MKPVVWEQLSRWHKKYVESGAELRMTSKTSAEEGGALYDLDSKLREAYAMAQGWTLSPEMRVASNLIGDKGVEALACTFGCGSSLSVGPPRGNYHIYGRVNDPVMPTEYRVDYLMSAEPLRYSVNSTDVRI